MKLPQGYTRLPWGYYGEVWLESQVKDLGAEIERLHKDATDWENACAHWEEEALASQAREAKLREALDEALGCIDGYYRDESYRTSLDNAFATSEMAYDDTALQEALKEAHEQGYRCRMEEEE